MYICAGLISLLCAFQVDEAHVDEPQPRDEMTETDSRAVEIHSHVRPPMDRPTREQMIDSLLKESAPEFTAEEVRALKELLLESSAVDFTTEEKVKLKQLLMEYEEGDLRTGSDWPEAMKYFAGALALCFVAWLFFR